MHWRPEPRGRTPLEHMVHQCMSEHAWMSSMLGIAVTMPVLPDPETRLDLLETYAACSAERLAALTAKPDGWFEEEVAFFDVPRSRAWCSCAASRTPRIIAASSPRNSGCGRNRCTRSTVRRPTQAVCRRMVRSSCTAMRRSRHCSRRSARASRRRDFRILVACRSPSARTTHNADTIAAIIPTMTEVPPGGRRAVTVRRFASAAEADRAELDYWLTIPAAGRVLLVWQLSCEQWALAGHPAHEPRLHRSVTSLRRR